MHCLAQQRAEPEVVGKDHSASTEVQIQEISL
jgi:hypothetical protein